MMIREYKRFDKVTVENSQEFYEYWPRISDHPYRILKVRGSGPGKINAILNLIRH